MDMTPQMWPDWYDGRHINEVLFCQQFLDKHPMKCVRGRLFTVDGLIEDEGQIGNLILEEISGVLTANLSKTVANLLASIKLQAYSLPLPIETDRIHVANGTYFMDGRFTADKSYCNNRLTVVYNPNAPEPKRWMQFLSELLQPEDIPTLQEFLGYCLLPTTKGQKMLMLIGKGGEGKSRIGLVMRSLLGDSMNTTSIQKVESNRFSRADLENKLLMVDDDMDMSALPKTNYIKSIVTSECKMDMERKGVQSYGRDVALEEGGEFTDLGYVRDTGSSFHEYYDGEHGSIPEEYRVMTFQDAEELTEEEKSEWAMDIAYDMDEFFRQHDPQYAAEHPEEHAAKEEIYENLMAGRISALNEKLAALGQTQEDYLPSEIEKFKDATGYEEFLDVDPVAIREAIQNPDKSHVDEMLAFAEQAGREYEAELAGQTPAPSPDDRETGETVRTPRGTFYVTDMSREQMEAAGYGLHHQSDDGKYLVMGNGSRSFAIRNEEVQEHITPEKMTVLVVEPMKKPYVKEIDPGLHSLQAEVGGDIATAYPFSDPVGLVCNDEGKLIGLELNRGLRDEHGEIYDIMAGTFLVVGLSEDSFTSLTPEQVQKYTEHFKQPEQFISLNGQIIALPAEPENPLRTAEMTLEDDYGMIDGVLNNGRRGEELEKAQGEARRTTPEKKPSIRERLAEAKRECGERKPPDKVQQKKPPEHDL